MRIEISGHQMDVTPALCEYVQSKFDKLERHSDQLLDGHVILSCEKLLKKAEATFNLSGHTIHAQSQAEDMYASIDLLLDKLDRQLLKHKEKITNHHRGDSVSRMTVE